ncbi:putative signal recognition particle binding protein [Dioszegia hungarica]|uniref:Signal recognition particle binding protein n=1 Tax=Dioszegia hungarica TaxID=4972 RepID=A0AA38HBC0_9TREE|nr:putative signal recognition particle binding protein [Dioszegia hungarica]KAI9637116.1 putative signal recognition particle binding protein [Dioszegia hungarica]
MLDHVSISHQSGLILWSRSFTPAFASLAQTPASPVNALVREVFIEGKVRGEDASFERDGYNVRWTMENGLGLVFVVVFPALLPLTYIPALLTRTKQLFLSLFQQYIQTLVDTLSATSGVLTEAAGSALRVLQQRMDDERWAQIFDRCLRNCEGDQARRPAQTPISLHRQAQLSAASGASTPGVPDTPTDSVTAEEIAKNVEALKSKMKGGRGKGGKGTGQTPSPSPSRKTGAAAKLMRKWGDSQVSAGDMAALDYSTPAPETPNGQGTPIDVEALVSRDAMGQRSKDGQYEVADWDFRGGKRAAAEDLPSEEEILARGTSRLTIDDKEDKEEVAGSSWSGIFSRLTGSKVLSKQDLQPVLAEMEKHLMDKNVAKDISEKMCDSVGAALVGKKLGGLSSVKSEVQSSLSSALTRVLTPKTSTDLLLDIQRKRSASTVSYDNALPDPYTLTFVGVNGVGKSTNLSKVCFWLLQNGLRVLIAACDTFRSGAVEQLRVHVRNLGALQDELGVGEKKVELYERGYGKDAAGIAKDAITYAKENKFDVVLIDTAGRMQDNEPLMRALAKLVTVNNPDKIIFVGEALVGNEAVDQLTKFDRALKDFSGAGTGGGQRKRGIDGIILTKFDTIDDKVGAALSMTYVTGQPILFVGCGQTYTDLRQLRVNHIVQALLN